MGSAGGFQNAGGYGAGVNVTIQVPNELVGLVIGKGLFRWFSNLPHND
jgi:hypothetical protein